MDCLYLSGISAKFSIGNCTTPSTSQDENHDNNDGGEEGKGESGPIVPGHVAVYFEVIFWVVTNFLVSCLGCVTNIINVIVYFKMGLGDVVNISLLGLAVSDFISVFTVVWLSICYGLMLLDPSGLLIDPQIFLYVTAGWPHFMFSRVSCYITAMVSVERCLCVVAPFKVNQIVTPRRIKFCLLIIFLAFPSAYLPTLVEHRLDWKFDPKRNETRISAAFTPNAKVIQAKSYFTNSILFPTIAFFIVIISVLVTARSLRQKLEWKTDKKSGVVVTSGKKTESERENGSGNKQDGGGPSIKEVRVIRMLTVICVLFLVCYSPSVIMIYVRIWVDGLDMFQKHHNLHLIIYGVIFLLEITNSSINAFIYYSMSTKYRQTFQSLFFRSKL